MKTLIEATIQYLGEADKDEIVRLQGALNKELEHPHFLALSTSLAKRVKAYYIANEYANIQTIKYIKSITALSLIESKDWFDEFIRPIKPAQYLIAYNFEGHVKRIYGTVDSLDIADFIVDEMNETNQSATDAWYYVPLRAVDRAELQRIKDEQSRIKYNSNTNTE